MVAHLEWARGTTGPHHGGRRAMRTRRFLMLSALASAVIFPLSIGGPALAHDSSGSHAIVGLWSLTDEILDSCNPPGNPVRTVIDLKMFLRDGNMIEAPGTIGVGAPPLKRGVPGLGSWQHVGERQYQASFRFFRYDSSNDTFAGTQTAVVDIELSKDGKSLTGTTTTNIYDMQGNLTLTRCTRSTGTRVE